MTTFLVNNVFNSFTEAIGSHVTGINKTYHVLNKHNLKAKSKQKVLFISNKILIKKIKTVRKLFNFCLFQEYPLFRIELKTTIRKKKIANKETK